MFPIVIRMSKLDDRQTPETGLAGSILLLTLLAVSLSVAGCANTFLLKSNPAGPLNPEVKQPDQYLIRREALAIHTNFELAANHRMIEDLVALRTDLNQKLNIPNSDEVIHVYLFQTPEQLTGFSRRAKHALAARRAYFVQTETTLSVYATWGDHVSEDLRHELTHGYLHSVAPKLPLWLDEGIAEYFEVPRGQDGVNVRHVQSLQARLKAGTFEPNLIRLEQLTEPSAMTQADYAESWLWIHFLLSDDQELTTWLRHHLTQWRKEHQAERLSARLAEVAPDIDQRLKRHLEKL